MSPTQSVMVSEECGVGLGQKGDWIWASVGIARDRLLICLHYDYACKSYKDSIFLIGGLIGFSARVA